MEVLTTMIVPAGVVDAARNIADCLSTRGEGMFVTGCSPTGAEPATHYISTGMISSSFTTLLANATSLYSYAQIGAQAQGKTLTATLTDAQAVVAQAMVSGLPGRTALANVGLALVDAPEGV